jgi:hypothetical protein
MKLNSIKKFNFSTPLLSTKIKRDFLSFTGDPQKVLLFIDIRLKDNITQQSIVFTMPRLLL